MTKKVEGRTSVEVLDAVMGSGKTSKIIEWMMKNPNKRYLYVSPMLSEVEERIPTACEALEFTFPNTDTYPTKSEHLLSLLREGCNISFTHSLFTDLTKNHLRLIKSKGYTLIIDEEVTFIEPYKGRYESGDILALEKAGHIRVNEGDLGKVEWLWEDMVERTQYTQLKRLCEMEMLYCTKRNREMMVVQLPVALVESSERTIILTYLFKGSVMESFLKLNGVEVDVFTEVELMKDTNQVVKEARELITICSLPSTKALAKYGLSSTWYSKNATLAELRDVGNTIRNVCLREGTEPTLLTLPKDSITPTKDGRKNSRYVINRRMSVDEIFLYCGARATNDYADKSVAIHAYNRYVNTVVKAYLQDYGEEAEAIPDDNLFALSEMIQWIWRTRIRNGQPIRVYIFSKRMEKLLVEWLEGGS